jgi:putative SbcD/Mre11-related phosphoesterase
MGRILKRVVTRAASIAFVHDDWLLTPERLAIHRPTATAVVADLHLGYSQRRQRLGDAVPLPTLADQLQPIWQAHGGIGFRRLVVAGDLFEGSVVPDLFAEFSSGMAERGIEWLGLVPGNHDRRAALADAIQPLWPDGVELGDWRVLHGDIEPSTGKRIMGHWHPAVRVQGRKVPCFLVSRDCVVLPAFSRDAAGVDVARDARWKGFRQVAVVGDVLVQK